RATDASRWVWNADSPAIRRMTEGVAGRHFTFSVQERDTDAWYDRENGRLMVLGEPILERHELTLLGDHNVANALASALALTVPVQGGETAPWSDRRMGRLMRLGEPILDRHELTLLGDHNVANALASALAVSVADELHRTGMARSRISAGLRSFRALAHRLE